MKKFLLSFTLLLSLVVMAGNLQENAQRTVPSSWNEMWFLSGLEKVRFALDLSGAVIDGVEAADYKEMESGWDEGVKDMTRRFISSFNKSAQSGYLPLRIGLATESDICFVLKVGEVTEDGSHVEGVFNTYDKNDNLLFSRKVSAEKGMFGSHLNLMGDALEKMGEDLGSAISNRIRDVSASNLKGFKQDIKSNILNGETIRVNVDVSSKTSKEIIDNGYASAVDDAFKADMEKTFRDAFYEALAKSLKGAVREDQVVTGGGDDGLTLDVKVVNMYPREQYFIIVAELFLKRQDEHLSYGIIENGELKYPKTFCTIQMEKIGKSLGKIK